jgi:hypothetical protein
MPTINNSDPHGEQDETSRLTQCQQQARHSEQDWIAAKIFEPREGAKEKQLSEEQGGGLPRQPRNPYPSPHSNGRGTRIIGFDP